MTLTAKERQALQVRAFHVAYRGLYDITSKSVRFAEAITMTSDEKFEQAMKDNPELIKQWKQEYYARKVR